MRHFFLSRQLPFEPGRFPGVGLYPSQQGFGFVVLGFVFFAVFFFTISDLKKNKYSLRSVLLIYQEPQRIWFPVPYREQVLCQYQAKTNSLEKDT